MRLPPLFARTLRQAPAEPETPSHQLLLRAGLVQQLAAGIYTFLPLGWRALRKIEQIIREEMDAAGGQEGRMPVLQPLPQGEDYREPPVLPHQIQTKFRNETRARGGLIRLPEFIMMGLYSFDADWAGLDRTYDALFQAYTNV